MARSEVGTCTTGIPRCHVAARKIEQLILERDLGFASLGGLPRGKGQKTGIGAAVT
jgi:hypothetical protein